MEKDSNRFGVWQKNSRANMLWSSSGWRRIRTALAYDRKIPERICSGVVVDGEGFEPSKASPADLQSVPFGHSGIHPWMNLLYTKKKVFARYFFSFFDVLRARACLKKHSRNLPAPLCSIFCLNSVAVARYGAFIRTKSSTNCDAHLAESFFQIRSRWMKKESITHFFCKEVDEWGKIC